MRTGLATLLSALLLAAAGPGAARADVAITVDKDAQRMQVAVDGVPRYSWPVSTGVARYDTPSGAYRPFRMERTHFSKEWDDAPMPFALFFTGQGHAIHGTNHTRALGRAASHGCIRLSVRNAATLFGLVKAQGMGNTRIRIEGEGAAVAEAGRAVRSARRRGNAYDFDDDQTGARAVTYLPVGRPAYAPAYGYGSGYGYGTGYGTGYGPAYDGGGW